MYLYSTPDKWNTLVDADFSGLSDRSLSDGDTVTTPDGSIGTFKVDDALKLSGEIASGALRFDDLDAGFSSCSIRYDVSSILGRELDGRDLLYQEVAGNLRLGGTTGGADLRLGGDDPTDPGARFSWALGAGLIQSTNTLTRAFRTDETGATADSESRTQSAGGFTGGTGVGRDSMLGALVAGPTVHGYLDADSDALPGPTLGANLLPGFARSTASGERPPFTECGPLLFSKSSGSQATFWIIRRYRVWHYRIPGAA